MDLKPVELPLRTCSKAKRTSVDLDDTPKILLRVLLTKCSAKPKDLCAVKGGLGIT